MPVAGLDVHKRIVQAIVLEDDGRIRLRARFECNRELLETFARTHLGRNARVALEATTNTWAIVSILEPLVGEVVVSNPLRTRAIAEAKVKTDKVDAEVLARLLAADFLPRVWRPDESTRTLRSLTARRASLVADRTGVKNRIHSVLHQRLIRVEHSELFGTKGRQWLATLELDPLGRNAIDSELRLLDAIDAEIHAMDQVLARTAQPDPRVALLMTLPGVSIAVAQTLLAALGQTDRFRDGDHAASYLGLVPSTRQSAERCYHGSITKQGNGHARWMLVQAAQHVGKHPGPLGHFFRKLAKKKNRNVAVVAVARKLVVIAWQMLRNNEPYRYAIPRSTETKLAKLRVQATGVRRKTGTAKGTPRSEQYGRSERMRVIPSIDQVYEREGLPALKPLSQGEARAVRVSGARAFVESIHTTQRVPWRSAKSDETVKESAKQRSEAGSGPDPVQNDRTDPHATHNAGNTSAGARSERKKSQDSVPAQRTMNTTGNTESIEASALCESDVHGRSNTPQRQISSPKGKGQDRTRQASNENCDVMDRVAAGATHDFGAGVEVHDVLSEAKHRHVGSGAVQASRRAQSVESTAAVASHARKDHHGPNALQDEISFTGVKLDVRAPHASNTSRSPNDRTAPQPVDANRVALSNERCVASCHHAPADAKRGADHAISEESMRKSNSPGSSAHQGVKEESVVLARPPRRMNDRAQPLSSPQRPARTSKPASNQCPLRSESPSPAHVDASGLGIGSDHQRQPTASRRAVQGRSNPPQKCPTGTKRG
jgi:transposase